MRSLALFFTFVALTYGQSLGEIEQPVCSSRFDHDYKVMQKLSDLEFDMKRLKEKVSSFEFKDPSKTPPATGAVCLDGWVAWESKCYYFLTENRNYTHAQEFCAYHGGKLAEPLTCGVNDFLKSRARQYKTSNWWIGLTDQEVEGDWVWRSSGNTPTYTDWKRGNPNQGRQCNCGGYWHLYDYGWVDEPCDYRYHAICEI